MRKVALFVFNGDPMCFIHVLLNGLQYHDAGDRVTIVVEGAAAGLLPQLEKPDHPLNALWIRAREAGIVAGVCRACAGKLKAVESANAQGIPLIGDMAGHPSMRSFQENGFEIITF